MTPVQSALPAAQRVCVLVHVQSMHWCMCMQALDTGADRDDDKAQSRPKEPVQSNGHSDVLAFQESDHDLGVTVIMCHSLADVVLVC